MKEYYALRAPVYDNIYEKPERQSDLDDMQQWLLETVSGRNVLEIACGTGYWTVAMSGVAQTVLATDINEPMLDIARQKRYPRENARFQCADFYDLKPGLPFDTLFGGFIWSHIALQDMEHWLDHLHSLLPKGSLFIFLDNNFVPGSSSPIARADAQGNKWQERSLPGGQTFEVIKNFPDQATFERLLKRRSRGLQILDFQYYWAIGYWTL